MPARRLVDAATAIFIGAGVSRSSARTVASALVDADLRGIPSHGLMLVPMYVDRLRAGSVSKVDRTTVVVDEAAIGVLDAGHGLGQVSAQQAMDMAIAKAKRHGVGVVSVRHAFHFGGAYRYVEQAAAAGCIGIAAANTRPLMPAPGGASPVVGNNPLAIGVPRTGHPPLIVDMALSEVALGKIRLAQAEKRTIPPTWATDADGNPTTDPAEAVDGMLLPAGGPKGFGLALMIDVLTGVLSGGMFGNAVHGLYADVTVPNDCSHFFLALDIAAFGPPEEVGARIASLVGQVAGSATAPGVARVFLPGERETEHAAKHGVDGVPVEDSVLEGLKEAAALVGVDLAKELMAS